jgi:plastocyanin
MEDHGAAAHGAGHGHGELPEAWETSIWPVVAALAAVIAALSLVWLAKDSDSAFAGPMAGSALAASVLAIGGWIWERRLKAKEEAEGLAPDAPSPRFTQVLTFTIAEGQLERARAEGGVIHAIEHADLATVPGYQDLRVIVAPAEDGPSQVLVETTWKGRDGLEGYNASRQNLLDLVSRHDEEVVAGAVQAFDMEVVRDTKHQAYRFGLPQALTILGGLFVGGFGFGAAQTAFEDEATIIENGGPPVVSYEIEATDNAFNRDTLVAPPATEVTFTMVAAGSNLHNLSFYESPGGTPFAVEDPISEGNLLVTFTTPGPGSYYFQCDVHPNDMNGTFEVVEGTPLPGGGPAGPEGPGGPQTVTATDNEFDVATIEAVAGQELRVTMVNDGEAQHNLTFLGEDGQILVEGATTGLIAGGESGEAVFTPPEAGSFTFICEVHPNDMTGEFIVREASGP